MTDPSLGRKKKKITIIASLKGIEVAENTLIRLGFDSKSNFAKSQLLARTTVTKFFQGEPIQLDSFKRICEALKLNWREITGLTEERQPTQLSVSSDSSPDTDGVVKQVQREHRQVTVIDQQSEKIKAVITLEGDVDSVQHWNIIQSALQEYSGDTIKITNIKEGSIRLFVEGCPEDIERLVSRIKSGELKTVTGFPVEGVQILSESSDDESTESDEKWRLVEDIVNQRVETRQLSDADLSDADLSDADLSDADLSGADLSGADLSDADLSRANLRGANIDEATQLDSKWRLVWQIVNHQVVRDLSNADLSDADLNRTNLNRANLNRANLNRAKLNRAKLISAHLIAADLSGADLIAADLSGADLSGADLSGANLSGAYLIGADLRDANLNRANLNRADLSSANLSYTLVTKALFGGAIGLGEEMKRDLEKRGAIFGDRPPVLSPK